MRELVVYMKVTEKVEYGDVEATVTVPDDLDVADGDAVREYLDAHESDWSDALDLTQQQPSEREFALVSWGLTKDVVVIDAAPTGIPEWEPSSCPDCKDLVAVVDGVAVDIFMNNVRYYPGKGAHVCGFFDPITNLGGQLT